MNDETIGKYIGEAIILLTADHLGVDVDMLETAKQVWNTKCMPDNPLLGRYATAADKAREIVLAKGLGERADRLGQVFYMTGEFPTPYEIRQYRDCLLMFTLRSTLGDCTSGGLTSQSDQFEVFAANLSFAQVADYCLQKQMDIKKVLKLVRRENYIHAEPIIDRHKWYMVGGNYIHTCDSRFKELTGIRYPVPVHDRTEV